EKTPFSELAFIDGQNSFLPTSLERHVDLGGAFCPLDRNAALFGVSLFGSRAPQAFGHWDRRNRRRLRIFRQTIPRYSKVRGNQSRITPYRRPPRKLEAAPGRRIGCRRGLRARRARLAGRPTRHPIVGKCLLRAHLDFLSRLGHAHATF